MKVKHIYKKTICSSMMIGGMMLMAVPLLSSCDDLFEPALENNLGIDYMTNNASYAEGVLGNAYTRIPCASFGFSEVATDDAVSNDAKNDFRIMASGTWTSDVNPTERWRDCRAGITYINLFLSKAEAVHWADDPIASEMYKDREMGEAYGLRAMFMYYLLQAHGGYTADGELLGVPIVTTPEDVSSEFNLPRNTFADCIKAIKADCDKALSLLPTSYVDINSSSDVPSKYAQMGATESQYNRVFGAKFNGRMNGALVEAFLSKAYILAASPAFSDGSEVTWAQAADNAAIVLDRIGGVAGMDPTGWTWYSNNSEIDGLSNGACPKEIMWRGEKSSNNDWETDNYPPSLYGKGKINPTQNFVDAFPMANGYPISDAKSNYDAAKPYADRDPRLSAYVVFNGSAVGVNKTAINTAADTDTKDGLDKVSGASTRTGYYLRKLLRQDINLDPKVNSKQFHYTPRIRFTEIFLNYAEAANEAYGPTEKGSHGYSAYDVVKAIRSRAGIGEESESGKVDTYLESIKDDKDKMRELIRNERRIELSFEGFRFWDLRRWKSPLAEDVKAMSINSEAGTYTVTDVKNESRNFKDYQCYGPIPYTEILKYNQLKQNQGW